MANKWQDKLSTDGMLVKSINGLRALTVENYNSQNVQNGLQFFLRAAFPTSDPIVAGGTRRVLFSTGDKKVIFKGRIVSYLGEEFKLELFYSPTVTDNGTPLVIGNYNGVNPVATSVTAFKDPTVTDDGIVIGDPNEPEYYFGGTSVGNRAANSIPEGRERILPENTSFIIKITNTSTSSGRFQYYGDWYEGEPAIPNNDLG